MKLKLYRDDPQLTEETLDHHIEFLKQREICGDCKKETYALLIDGGRCRECNAINSAVTRMETRRDLGSD